MKKILLSIFTILLSTMVFAIDWSSYEFLGDGAGGGAYSNKYKVATAEGQSVVNIQKPGFADEAGIYTTFPAGISSCSLGEGNYAIQGAGMVLYLSAFTNQETEVTVTAADVNYVFTVYYADGTPSGTPSKQSAELTLNATEKTLDAAISETFQIVATRQGDGAISYESNKPGIASVSASGLVTAVGRGTAVITVKVAETDTYEAASKKLTVTVNGPVNWDGLDWVANSNDKFKVATAEGQTVVNVQKPGFAAEDGIYTTFPAGISTCSLPEGKYAIDGAGIVLYLSAFTAQVTDVTVVDAMGTYDFQVYYADGETDTTAIERVYNNETRTRKVIDGGMIVIVKDGVKYNVLGVRL